MKFHPVPVHAGDMPDGPADIFPAQRFGDDVEKLTFAGGHIYRDGRPVQGLRAGGRPVRGCPGFRPGGTQRDDITVLLRYF